MTLDEVKAVVAKTGVSFRGAFHPDPDDLPDGERAGTIVMLGFVGGENWPVFKASGEYQDRRPHPLDRWSYRVVTSLAKTMHARAYFPFTAPFMPFIRWAKKAEPVTQSEMGMMIHPEYGLWHAWRGALGFDAALELPAVKAQRRPCDSCIAKPCLSACPVNAFGGGGAYDVAACGAHLRAPEGAACMSGGCLARRACPVGEPFQYEPEQAAFHMKSFRGY